MRLEAASGGGSYVQMAGREAKDECSAWRMEWRNLVLYT